MRYTFNSYFDRAKEHDSQKKRRDFFKREKGEISIDGT